jgi:hypothetical protein
MNLASIAAQKSEHAIETCYNWPIPYLACQSGEQSSNAKSAGGIRSEKYLLLGGRFERNGLG